MENKIGFGECLSTFLAIREWSAAKLAKELNLDSSYIRRWIRGERVPSLKSNYIKQISACLSTGLDLKSKKPIKDMFYKTVDNMHIGFSSHEELSDLILKALSDAQVYSLKLSPDERIAKISSGEDDIVSFLEKIKPGIRKMEKELHNYENAGSLSAIPPIIHGRKAVLFTYIRLVRCALELYGKTSGEILLSFQSGDNIFDGYPKLYNEWFEELKAAIQKDWKIKQVLCINKDLRRSLNIVEKIIKLGGYKGRYEPYYFNRYLTIGSAIEFLIIPEVGALVCLSTVNKDNVDTAFFFNQPDAIQTLVKYFDQILQDTVPLVNIYSRYEYWIKNTETGKKAGDHFSISNDLDSLSIPYPLWKKYLHSTIDEIEVKEHEDRIYSQIQAFYTQVERYKFKNICTVRAIEHLTSHKEYYSYNLYRKPDSSDIVENLEYVIYLLKKYENYEIALLSESQINLLPPVSLEMKGDYSVVMDIWYPEEDGNKNGLFLAVTEGTIAGAFKDYFIDLWDKILPKYKDKENVISFFENQLKWFKEKENLD